MRKNNKNNILRAFTAFLAFLFLVSDLRTTYLFAASQDSQSRQVFKPISADFAEFKIPESLGQTDSFKKGNSGKIVVLIQDAHAIPDAQRNIRALIEYFQGEYGVNTVALEGADSALDPQIFRSFPDKEKLAKVFQRLQEKGELAGGPAAAVFSPFTEFNKKTPARYLGVEEQPLYEEGIRAWLEADSEREGLDQKARQIRDDLEGEKKKIYGPRLYRLDQKLERFFSNKTSLPETLEALAGVKEPVKGSEIFLLLNEVRSASQPEKLEAEVRAAAETVRKGLQTRSQTTEIQKALTELNQAFQQLNTSQLSPQAFALILKNISNQHKIPVRVSNQLAKGARHQEKLEDIRGGKLYEALKVYAQSVKESLFRNDAERDLDRRSQQQRLLESFIHLELSPEEWEGVKAAEERGRKGEGEQKHEKAFSSGRDFQAFLRPHFDFYRLAEARDKAFLKNLQKILAEKNTGGRALMVAGGFHARNLARLFESEEISYLLVTPKINSIPEQTSYRDQMRGNVSFRHYFEVENGKVSLYKAFVRAVRDKLLDTEKGRIGNGEHSPHLVKSWRDQIIRDLAAQNRIADAGQYTGFLDELISEKNTGHSDAQKIIAKARGFTEGVWHLYETGRLNRENVLGLFKPAASATAPITAVMSMVSRSKGGRQLGYVPMELLNPVGMEMGRSNTEQQGNPLLDSVQRRVLTGRSENRIVVNKDNFVSEILRPKMGAEEGVNLEDEGVLISEGRDEKGDFLQVKGRWEFKIRFGASKAAVPQYPSDKEVNEIAYPRNEIGLESARNVWARMVVGDDKLNERFRKRTVEALPYQLPIIEAAVNDLKEHQKHFIPMATGTGKTFVGLKTMREYNRFLDQQYAAVSDPGVRRKRGVTLFVVNNTEILNQTIAALQKYYPGEYAEGPGGNIGRIFDGDQLWDENTEIIFATPISLMNSERIDALIATRGVDLAIFDETHHLPATQNRILFNKLTERDSRKPVQTAVLGLTATEVGRLDKQSIFPFYSNRINPHAYRTPQAQAEGNLAAIDYRMADGDILSKIGLSADSTVSILPGSSLDQHYEKEQYETSRFPWILAQYRQHRKAGGLGKTLIVTPSIRYAESLAAFFQNPRIEGRAGEAGSVNAITLTSADRSRDKGRWFDDVLAAWRSGVWPVRDTDPIGSDGKPKSPYSNEPVPEVVVAVDIFNEGVDVPGIDLVMLLTGTESAIKYIQVLGRGLRLEPGKTHLRVLDFTGLIRSPAIVAYLGQINDYGRNQQRKPGAERGGGQGAVPESSFDDEYFDQMEQLNLGANASQLVANFMGNVPLRLYHAYREYGLVPPFERERLDDWFAFSVPNRFVSTESDTTDPDVISEAREKFYDYCNDIAEYMLNERRNPGQQEALREIIQDHFYLAELGQLKDSADAQRQISNLGFEKSSLPNGGTGFLIFERIRDKVFQLGEFTEAEKSRLYEVFPEFKPDIMKKRLARNRMQNFTFFRQHILEVNEFQAVTQLTQELNPQDLSNHRRELINLGADVARALDSLETQGAEAITSVNRVNDATFTLRWAEGVSEGGSHGSESDRSARGTSSWARDSVTSKYQEFFSAAYAQLILRQYPDLPLKNEIVPAMFDLEPKAFKAKLKAVGLLSISDNPVQFITGLTKSVNKYSKYFGLKQDENRLASAAEIMSLLMDPATGKYVEIPLEGLGKKQFQRIKEFEDVFADAVRSLPSLLDPNPDGSVSKEVELREKFFAFLDHIGLRRSFKLEGGSIQVTAHKRFQEGGNSPFYYEVSVIRDANDKVQRFLKPQGFPATIKMEWDNSGNAYASLDFKGSQLESLYGELSDPSELMELIAALFLFVDQDSPVEGSVAAAVPVYSSGFGQALTSWLKESTPMDILYGAAEPYDYEAIHQNSRLNFLNEEFLQENYWYALSGWSPTRITRVFANIYLSERVLQKAEEAASQIEVFNEVPDEFPEELFNPLKQDVLFYLRSAKTRAGRDLNAISTLRSFLQLLAPEEAPKITADSILLAATSLDRRVDYIDASDYLTRRTFFATIQNAADELRDIAGSMRIYHHALPPQWRDRLMPVIKRGWQYYELEGQSAFLNYYVDMIRSLRSVDESLKKFNKQLAGVINLPSKFQEVLDVEGAEVGRTIEVFSQSFNDIESELKDKMQSQRALLDWGSEGPQAPADEEENDLPEEDESPLAEDLPQESSIPLTPAEEWLRQHPGSLKLDGQALELIYKTGEAVLHADAQCPLAPKMTAKNMEFTNSESHPTDAPGAMLCPHCVPPEALLPEIIQILISRSESRTEPLKGLPQQERYGIFLRLAREFVLAAGLGIGLALPSINRPRIVKPPLTAVPTLNLALIDQLRLINLTSLTKSGGAYLREASRLAEKREGESSVSVFEKIENEWLPRYPATQNKIAEQIHRMVRAVPEESRSELLNLIFTLLDFELNLPENANARVLAGRLVREVVKGLGKDGVPDNDYFQGQLVEALLVKPPLWERLRHQAFNPRSENRETEVFDAAAAPESKISRNPSETLVRIFRGNLSWDSAEAKVLAGHIVNGVNGMRGDYLATILSGVVLTISGDPTTALAAQESSLISSEGDWKFQQQMIVHRDLRARMAEGLKQVSNTAQLDIQKFSVMIVPPDDDAKAAAVYGEPLENLASHLESVEILLGENSRLGLQLQKTVRAADLHYAAVKKITPKSAAGISSAEPVGNLTERDRLYFGVQNDAPDSPLNEEELKTAVTLHLVFFAHLFNGLTPEQQLQAAADLRRAVEDKNLSVFWEKYPQALSLRRQLPDIFNVIVHGLENGGNFSAGEIARLVASLASAKAAAVAA